MALSPTPPCIVAWYNMGNMKNEETHFGFEKGFTHHSSKGVKHLVTKGAKHKALQGHIEGGGGRKIDVYHNGVYAHSTNMSRTLKHAKETSRLEGGKVTAKYDKNR